MLILLQIPVFDLRKFLEKKGVPICKPNWKFIEDSDVLSSFIRSIGPIDKRGTGKNSAGENYFSKARRSIRFVHLPVIRISENGNERFIQVKPRFRRFFFDGTVCGKYEIGFTIELKKNQYISSQSFKEFISSLFDCKVIIPVPFKANIECSLIKSGSVLAKQYLYATTQKKNIAHEGLQGVYAGLPCIYFERLENEKVLGNIIAKSKDIKQLKGVSIGLTELRINNRLIKVWYSIANPTVKITLAREIRIAILRLNVFREALHFVLKSIESNALLPKPRSNESEALQSFFKDCFGKYLKKLPDVLSDSDYEVLAIRIEDQFTAINRKQLEDNLRKVIDIRGNYFTSIKEYLGKLENSFNGKLTNQVKIKTEEKIITRVFVAFSNPKGTRNLRLGNEDRVIREAIKLSKSKDSIEVDTCQATRIDDLRRALLDKDYRIVQISGHGTASGLILENESGNRYVVPQAALADLFKAYCFPDDGKLECVILNACYTINQGQLISLGIPFTIAMEEAINNSAAIEFSKGFYDAIGAQKTIEFAYDEGCRAVKLALPDAQFNSVLLRKDRIK